MNPKCVCGHRESMHDERFGCIADRCMNVCVTYRPIIVPRPGERPVFGVHRVMPGEAWTPEPLSGYWQQKERWKP
jgi:hypothetical protein